jgi:hypothetical protein
MRIEVHRLHVMPHLEGAAALGVWASAGPASSAPTAAAAAPSLRRSRRLSDDDTP